MSIFKIWGCSKKVTGGSLTGTGTAFSGTFIARAVFGLATILLFGIVCMFFIFGITTRHILSDNLFSVLATSKGLLRDQKKAQ